MTYYKYLLSQSDFNVQHMYKMPQFYFRFLLDDVKQMYILKNSDGFYELHLIGLYTNQTVSKHIDGNHYIFGFYKDLYPCLLQFVELVEEFTMLTNLIHLRNTIDLYFCELSCCLNLVKNKYQVFTVANKYPYMQLFGKTQREYLKVKNVYAHVTDLGLAKIKYRTLVKEFLKNVL